MTATPATTPPAIAPAGDDLAAVFGCAVAEVMQVVEESDAVSVVPELEVAVAVKLGLFATVSKEGE